jgi:hypothetical protein
MLYSLSFTYANRLHLFRCAHLCANCISIMSFLTAYRFILIFHKALNALRENSHFTTLFSVHFSNFNLKFSIMAPLFMLLRFVFSNLFRKTYKNYNNKILSFLPSLIFTKSRRTYCVVGSSLTSRITIISRHAP